MTSRASLPVGSMDGVIMIARTSRTLELYATMSQCHQPKVRATDYINRALRQQYISLPSLYDYDVRLLNFAFCGGGEHKASAQLR